MNNQSVILSKDITSGDITPLISANNVLLTSRPSLNQLTNVAINDLQDNQVLTYDAGGDLWYNADSQGSTTTLTALTDVVITEPANGQYLQYDTSLAIPKWVNKTPQYLSYSVNAYPLNSKFNNQTFFSIFATSTFNETPTPVYNYNFSNNITLSTETGVITELDATKTYLIQLNIMKVTTGASNGLHTLSLFTDSPDAIPNGTSIILNTSIPGNSTNPVGCYTPSLNAIITGQTQVCPTLKFNFFAGVTAYTGVPSINNFNATINIREL